MCCPVLGAESCACEQGLQTCVNLRGNYYRCKCNHGYTLAEDKRHCLGKFILFISVLICTENYMLADLFTDINECEHMMCGQICHNSIGSYQCQCLRGYKLSIDKHTCKVAGNH